METQRINISDLACDPANVRAHDGKNLDAIKASLQRFGQQKPIVVDEKGVVIAGNGTLTAARALGWDAINIVRTELAGAEATAYAIADNRTAELAEWDDEALAKQLSALQIEDEALVEAAGFSDAELVALVDQVTGINEGITDPDEVPEAPVEPTTQPGQIWKLGEHRLMCGDSTSQEDVLALFNGEKANAVITDPPYGVDYVGKTKDALLIENDGKDGLEDLLDSSLRNAFDICEEGGAWYVAAPPGPQFGDFAKILGELEVWRQTIAWVKDSMVLGHSDYHYKHEAIFYGWKPGAAHKSVPDRKQTTVWEFDRPKRSAEHPTMKPVAIYVKMLENSTERRDVIFEPFCGSGTTLIASEQTGRKCRGMEISPAYCDVIIKRWEEFTGQEAELVDG